MKNIIVSAIYTICLFGCAKNTPHPHSENLIKYISFDNDVVIVSEYERKTRSLFNKYSCIDGDVVRVSKRTDTNEVVDTKFVGKNCILIENDSQ